MEKINLSTQKNLYLNEKMTFFFYIYPYLLIPPTFPGDEKFEADFEFQSSHISTSFDTVPRYVFEETVVPKDVESEV